MEDNGKNRCPTCQTKRQRVSRYEWFLADALHEELLMATNRPFRITEQWEMPDHRGFSWYYDLAVHVTGKSSSKGHTVLIEVNGSDHDRQAVYSGPGGGYTRDYDKEWEFGQRGLHKKGYSVEVVTNEDCRLKVVKATAKRLAALCVQRADSW